MHRFLTYEVSGFGYINVECEHKGEQAFVILKEKGRRGEKEGTRCKKMGYKPEP